MFIFIYLFIFGCAGSSFAVCRLSLVAASRGYSLVVVCGLLIVVASVVAEQRLCSAQASVVAACGLTRTPQSSCATLLQSSHRKLGSQPVCTWASRIQPQASP